MQVFYLPESSLRLSLTEVRRQIMRHHYSRFFALIRSHRTEALQHLALARSVERRLRASPLISKSVLPAATPHKVRDKMLLRLLQTVQAGFWWCFDCESVTEREEGEQGQPAHCSRCGGHRIEWNRPATRYGQAS